MTQRREHLFVVRMWQERGDMTPAERASRAAPWGEGWRGSVQHVPSGERAYFIQLSDMNEFVRSQLARASESTNQQISKPKEGRT